MARMDEFLNNLARGRRGCHAWMVLKVCKLARDGMRRILDYVWGDSEGASKILKNLQERNEDMYRFEKLLEDILQTIRIQG